LSTHRGWLVYIAFTIALGLGGPQAARASDAAEAEALVTKARLALENFQRDPDMAPLRRLANRAWAMLIMPELLKGGFIVGGSGGNGVLLARRGAGQPWHGPAFYTVGGISFGLQIGAELSEVVMLAMTRRGMTTMLSSSVKLGADVNVAVGPIGAGAEAATAGLSVDLLVFSRSKGLYGGISLQGAVISTRDTLNHAFYGRAVSTTDILLQGTALSDKATGLLMSVSQFPQAR
jgi:lipid-binding SYLF domain-containing protein